MNTVLLANLFVIAAAPRLDPSAPLAIEVTPRGRRTVGIPVPVTRPRQAMQPASCVECKLCNIHGELTCSDCQEAKETANATRIDADR